MTLNLNNFIVTSKNYINYKKKSVKILRTLQIFKTIIIIGATGNHVHTSSYPAEFESFDGNADYLDDWVFNKVQEFFVDARKNETLYSQLGQDKVVFFLHLLGIDTNGHAFNPTSP